MKSGAILVLLVCCLAHQTTAWPFGWFQTTSTTPAPPTTVTTPLLPTDESPTIWNNLYNTLKGIFNRKVTAEYIPTDPSNTSSISTKEPFKTTVPQMTPTDDQGLFDGFFASLANSFARIYETFSSEQTNTTQQVETIKSYPQLLADEVDSVLKNYSFPLADTNMEIVKTSIMNALMSAWNASVDLGDIPVVSPNEIQDKILETLDVFNKRQSTNVTTDTVTVTTIKPTTVTVNPDKLQNKLLEILKKANRQPDDTSDPFNEPSSYSRSEEDSRSEKDSSNWGTFWDW